MSNIPKVIIIDANRDRHQLKDSFCCSTSFSLRSGVVTSEYELEAFRSSLKLIAAKRVEFKTQHSTFNTQHSRTLESSLHFWGIAVNNSCNLDNTFSTWPLTRTLSQTAAILPSGAIKNVDRTTPIYSLPIIKFARLKKLYNCNSKVLLKEQERTIVVHKAIKVSVMEA